MSDEQKVTAAMKASANISDVDTSDMSTLDKLQDGYNCMVRSAALFYSAWRDHGGLLNALDDPNAFKSYSNRCTIMAIKLQMMLDELEADNE